MYFSGFCLENEKEVFKEYLEEDDFTISGFSAGAIKAVEHVLYCLDKNIRVDTLQLFSPSYFVSKDEKYKRMQTMYFKKNAKEYIDNFIRNISYPSNDTLKNYVKNGSADELFTLLSYPWEKEKMQKIVDAKVHIEVFIGGKDKIINAEVSKDFFKEFAMVYFIKDAGHTLQTIY